MSAPTRAAGALLWRRNPCGEVEVAVVHRPRYDDWSLPKGKVDPGETIPVAAAREVLEETGFIGVLGRFLLRTEYGIGAGLKTVDYFATRVCSGRFRPNEEVDELKWLPPAEAKSALSYDTDRSVLEEFLSLPTDLTTLLLVRHGKAGKRETWRGDDDLRPLSHAGQRQAQALRVMVRPFGPDRVLSAPRLRCVQTVQGVAEDLGVEVRHEPLLAEETFARDPVAGVERVRAIVADGGTPLLCSQGGVIPHVVAVLAEEGGIPLHTASSDGVPSKKGSVWLLSFVPATATSRARLVAAHYMASPLPTPAPANS